MMGGTTLTTEAQVRAYSMLLKQQFALGEHIEEPECLPPQDPRWIAALEAGRECPRVDLDPDNTLPYELLLLAASEHTRPVFGSYFRAACGELSREEQLAVLSRVHAGLMSEEVVAKLYPKPEPRT